VKPLEEGEAASESKLSAMHNTIAENINTLIEDQDPRIKLQALKLGIQFLKDNRITATSEAEPRLNDIVSKIPTAEELEKLMSLTPPD
jgi:hypothetical protein